MYSAHYGVTFTSTFTYKMSSMSSKSQTEMKWLENIL